MSLQGFGNPKELLGPQSLRLHVHIGYFTVSTAVDARWKIPRPPTAKGAQRSAPFAWGGFYWALATQRFPRVIRFERDTQNWPPVALLLAFLTRIVQAFGVAAITAFAGINGPAGGRSAEP